MKKLLPIAFLFAHTLSFAQSIYEIQGQTATSPYNNQTVNTQGIVTAIYSNSYFIQDGDSAWTGLYIYDQSQTPALGDSIELTGTVTEYYEMTELKNVNAYEVLSTGNTLPDPIIVQTGEVTEKWESVLIKVENAICTNTDLGYGEWEVNDGSGSVVINDLGIAFAPIINVAYSITGPLDYSFNLFKIEPRTADDIEINLPMYFTKDPVPKNIQTNQFDINLITNAESKAIIEYGLTPEFELGKIMSSVSSTTHQLTLNNLSPGTIYHAKSYAVGNSNDTTPIFTGVYATQSESSGEIYTYFNHPHLTYPLKNNFTENIVDTIISYINKAQTSLDITMYDLTNHAEQSDSSNYKIIQAINHAHRNGILVRFITDDAPSNAALDSVDASIPIIRGNTEGIMHNKFLIIDVNDAEKAWVVTGSTNWTYNNLFMDFNNMVCIQDQSLAKAYTIEFNEMWGSTTQTPNATNARFGSEKTDNTPHKFNVNHTTVELYFSPSDNTTEKIAQAIDNAVNNIDFAMMVFTENQLGTAMLNAHKRGVTVNGFIDYVEYSGSEFDYLKNNGLPVTDFANESNESWPNDKTLHHKYCIVDLSWGVSPLLITGTHNWSASAESRNDENTLFIHNGTIADAFKQEFDQIDMYINNGGNNVKNKTSSTFNTYPNPSTGKVFVSNTNQEPINQVIVYSLTGQKLQSFENINSHWVELDITQKGLFLIEVLSNNERKIEKVIVE